MTGTLNETIRAGARVLGLFEGPLHAHVLRAHAEGPCRFPDLQDRVGWQPEATLRGAIRNLEECGGLVKKRVEGQGNAVSTSLGPAGRELLSVADALESWLYECPRKPIELDTNNAKVAVKALAGGWNSSLMRELGAGPRTLTELSTELPELSYSSLERRLGWMRTTGQIEALPKEPAGTPYVATDWLRRAITPLAMASRCERRHMTPSSPITDVEVETGFLLGLPMARLPDGSSGTCMVGMQTDGDPNQDPPLAGVTVEVLEGRPVTWSASLEAAPPTWVVGSAEAWLDAMIGGRFEVLRIGGADPDLAADLISGLRFALFIDW
ncbi:MAG TPA: winged helix-turn-helix transcriptional regulator [Solirubrobacterales bacterium]|nr:winged helix-turn-helix transcriptional regulator [Solirubrobacterales bacterium]